SAGVPGLKGLSRLPATVAADLRSQLRGLQEAQTRLLMAVDPVVIDKGERARFVIDELESALEYTLDDGVEEPADAQLTKVQEFHAQDGQRSSALAQSLLDYGALAESLKTRLTEADSDFDATLIDEAKTLAVELTAAPKPPQDSPASNAATRIRNGFLALVTETVRQVRGAARRRFRAQPEIIREATSAWERRRRAAARRAKLKEGKPAV
ncbi:MAG: hypothetical protein IT373_13160, partial [Polyangiaceae bacterium]|nr:hypothetical protein [Polyangiaceae bacterium]